MKVISRVQRFEDGLSLVIDVAEDGTVETREEWDPTLSDGQRRYRKGRLREKIKAESKAASLQQKISIGAIVVQMLPILAELARGTVHEEAATKLAELVAAEEPPAETDVESEESTAKLAD